MGSYLIGLVKENKFKIDEEKEINDKKLFLLEQKVKIFKTFFQLALISVAGILYINHEISLGAIIAVSLLISKLISPLSLLYLNLGSVFKILDLIDISDVIKDNKKENINIAMKDNNIQIEFLEKKETIKLNKGDILIITGMNGSGKTTMIENIMKSIDVVDYKIGYLAQNPKFISGTIEELISNFSEKKEGFVVSLKKSMALSGSGLFIQNLKNNIKTQFEKDKISMGELQKISLARAFFDNPNMIVLDEPENNLDYNSLEIIIKSIKDLSNEGSIFIIATKNKQIKAMGNKNIVLKSKISE